LGLEANYAPLTPSFQYHSYNSHQAFKEWEIAPKTFEFQAGERVTFNIKNDGQFGHALEVSNSAMHLHSPTVRGGESTTLEVTFEYGGKYSLLCPIPGHAAQGMVGEANVAGGTPPPATTEFKGIPLMRVSLPTATRAPTGSQIKGSVADVQVVLHDFTLAPNTIGGANKPGEGHWLLYLDDVPLFSVGVDRFPLGGLTPGRHTVKAELRNNDRSALATPVSATASFEVVAGDVTPPSVGDKSVPLAANLALGLGLASVIGGGAIVLMRRRRSRGA
jgi:plastocyanin